MTPASLELTILGCGSSGGVPRLGDDWGACDPANPRNYRTRCSLLVERKAGGAATRVLVDTSPDLRAQLLAAGVCELDAVVYSHDHADQAHGIDDLRPVTYHTRRRTPVYMDAVTTERLTRRFDYCFVTPPGGSYAPILQAREMPEPGEAMAVEGAGGPIPVVPLAQDHGHGVESLGFRFGEAAYSNDVVTLPEASLEALAGVRVWIVDALRYTPHPTHAHLDRALGWIDRIRPELAVLTNLHIDMDYDTLRAELPAGVVPAHDGMKIVLDAEGCRIAE